MQVELHRCLGGDPEPTDDGGISAPLSAAALGALCEGHFPDGPLVPGAYLLALMVGLVGLRDARAPLSATVVRAIFRSPVLPEGRPVVRARPRSASSWRAEVAVDGAAACSADLELGRAGERPGVIAEGAAAGAATPPSPSALLRHRGPALLVDRIDGVEEGRLTASGAAGERWWPELLEGGAQAAGLLAGVERDGLPGARVVAAYFDVRVYEERIEGPVRWTVRPAARALGVRQFDVTASVPGHAPALSARAALAPAQPR